MRRILKLMAEFHGPSDLYKEDPLDSLLDQETDEEFGEPRFADHFADSLTPAVLKDWSAKDFASIYVRFRPHLERHAKRFLVNPSQVEEVVQDAFLYLMTNLPELDSELGVLKFLKWKTRLLALDVIRANSRVSIAPLDGQREFEADLPEISQELERADDAAIVGLALAKLQPRHREALIATLYEEKSAEVVSAQMGLSENAFRQLLFRSRAAFKKALIGEAETAGLSMSAVLSIAARKAAAESGKLISVAGAFLLVLALSIGVIPNLSANVSEETVSQPQPAVSESLPAETSPAIEPESVSTIERGSSSELNSPEADEDANVARDEAVSSPGAPEHTTILAAGAAQVPAAVPAIDGSARYQPDESGERIILAGYLREALGTSAAARLATSGSSVAVSSGTNSQGNVEIDGGSGLSGKISYDLNSQAGIQDAWFTLRVEGKDFISAPQLSFSQKTVSAEGIQALSYIATDLLIGDTTGDYDFIAINDTVVSRSAVQVNLIFDATGVLIYSSISLTPRT